MKCTIKDTFDVNGFANSVDFNPKNPAILAAFKPNYDGDAGSVLFLDVEKGAKQSELSLEGLSGAARLDLAESVCFMPDGAQIYVGNAHDGRLVSTRGAKEAEESVSFGSLGAVKVYKSGKDGYIVLMGRRTEIYDIDTKKVVWTTDSEAAVEAGLLRPVFANILPNGKKLYVCDGKGLLNIYSIDAEDKYSSLDTLAIGLKQLRDLQISQDGKLLCAIETNTKGTVLYDLKTKERLFPNYFNETHECEFSALFMCDSKYLALGNISGWLTIYDTSTGKLVSELKVPGGRIYEIKATPDFKLLALACDNGVYTVSLDLSE